MGLGGAAGAPRGRKRQISGAEGAQKEKRQILGRRRPFYLMVYHLSSSNLVFLGTYFNRPQDEKFLGGKNLFLLAKCSPKGGENFGRQILGGKVGKEADFGGSKKKYRI